MLSFLDPQKAAYLERLHDVCVRLVGAQ